MEIVTPTLTPSHPLTKYLLSVPTTICSPGLEVLILEREVLLPGDTINIPLNWKIRLTLSHARILMPLSQQAKKSYNVGRGD